MAGLAGMGSRPLALMHRQLNLTVLSRAVLMTFGLASEAGVWRPDFDLRSIPAILRRPAVKVDHAGHSGYRLRVSLTRVSAGQGQ